MIHIPQCFKCRETLANLASIALCQAGLAYNLAVQCDAVISASALNGVAGQKYQPVQDSNLGTTGPGLKILYT
jgi:hypothetical protein